MNKEKGFTLIELLAILVIIGIVAAITYPLISNIIDQQRKKAFKTSIEGILSSTEALNAGSGFKVNAVYTFSIDKLVLIEENGQAPSDPLQIETSGMMKNGTGYAYVNENGDLAVYINNGIWCGYKGYKDKTVTIIDYDAETCKDENQ